MLRNRSTRGRRLAAALIAVSCVAAACGGDDDDDASPDPADTEAPAATDAPADSESPAETSGEDTTAPEPTTGTPVEPSSTVMKIGVTMSQLGGSHLDPALYTGNPDSGVWYNALYDTLMTVGPDGSIVPGLAESWETPDDSTLTLNLRPDVTFHDGTPFNAEAVKFSWDRNKELSPVYSFYVHTVAETEVVDDLTVKVTFDNPVAADFIPYLAIDPRNFAVVSPTAVEELGEGFNDAPVGAGPYKFESWVKDQEIKLVPYEGYWNPEATRFAGWEIYNVPPGTGRVSALRSGQVNATVASTADIAPLEGDGFGVVNTYNNPYFPTVLGLVPCSSKPPFDTLEARQALAYALDRDEINTGAYGGGSEATLQLTQPSQGDNHVTDVPNEAAYDPEQARELLTAAGVAEGQAVTMLVNANTGEISLAAQIIQQQLGEVGIQVEIVESLNYVADLTATLPELSLTQVPLGSLAPFFGNAGFANPCNVGTQALWDGMAEITRADPAAVQAGWQAIETEIAEQAIMYPLVTMPVFWVHSDEVDLGGWRPNPLTSHPTS